MTALDLLKQQLDDARIQITSVFVGFPEDKATFVPSVEIMSAKMTLQHLAECYEATRKHLVGEEHSWGTFSVDAPTLTELASKTFAMRDSVVADVLANGTEDAMKTANSYIVLHDCYHVGQMCAIRMHVEPEWNAYSIYGM